MANRTPLDMAGHVVAVLGCGPGIGLTTARILADCHAAVACVDVVEEVATASAGELTRLGLSASAHRADVLDRAALRTTFADIAERHGGLTGVVNVVGRSLISPLAELGDADWDDQLSINLRHHFVAAQEAVRHLGASSGAYVAIGSIDGFTTAPDRALYGMSKAGLAALIRNFALEFGPKGIRLNIVAPGLVRTPRVIERGLTEGALGEAFTQRIPLGRIVDPEDVGHAALFLLSDLSRCITGQVITVDGGTSLHHPLPPMPAIPR